jgi:hypothetical protein
MSTSAFPTTSRNQVLSKAIVHPAEKMREFIELQPIAQGTVIPEIVRADLAGTRPSLAQHGSWFELVMFESVMFESEVRP